MCKLVLKNINKKYGNKRVISNLNISIKEGERISILGPSGCGKSTMLGVMAGLLVDFEGKIYLDEKDITNLPSNKRNIVIVNQENLLFPHMNVFDNIAFGLKVRKKDKSYIKERVNNLLEEIGLKNYGNKKVNKLSGGEKQRVALARALAVNPEILLLDEAYSSLDTNLRDKMRALTIKLQEKHNITTILVTHDKEEAIRFSNRVGVMLGGTIMQIDTPRNVYENPKSLEIAKFMVDNNFIEWGNKTVFIKIEDIIISKEKNSCGEFLGEVKKVEYSGSRNIYTIDVLKKDIENYLIEEKNGINDNLNSIKEKYNKGTFSYDTLEKVQLKIEDNKNNNYILNEKVYLKIVKKIIF